MKKLQRLAKMITAPCALYLLALMPRMLNRPDKSLFGGRYFAHRGLHDDGTEAPENSMEAFRRAVEAGYGIELDVHITRDGVPAVFHDDTLTRMCGVDLEIEKQTYDELRQYTLGDSGEHIPRLSEVLEMVAGRQPLIVEIKSDRKDVSCCAAVDRLLRTYGGAYCIESFNPMVLLWFRRNHNSTIRGQLSTNFKKDGEYRGALFFLLTHLVFNFLTKPDFISYNHEFASEPGRALCRRLYRNTAVAWTVRSREELLEAQKGFDVFIFEGFCP